MRGRSKWNLVPEGAATHVSVLLKKQAYKISEDLFFLSFFLLRMQFFGPNWRPFGEPRF